MIGDHKIRVKMETRNVYRKHTMCTDRKKSM